MRKSFIALFAVLFAGAAWAQVNQYLQVPVPVQQGGTGANNAADAAVNLDLLPATLASGQIFVGNAMGAAMAQTLTGDCSMANTGAITCTKTNGTAFASSARIDTTNAANITSGTLPSGRLTGAYTGVTQVGTLTVAGADALTLRSGSTSAGSFAQASIGRTGADANVRALTQGADLQMSNYTGAAAAGDIEAHAITGSLWLTSAAGIIRVVGGNATFSFIVGTSGGGNIIEADQTGAVKFANIATTTSAANAVFDAANANNALRSTSSIRYKTNVVYFDAAGDARSGPIIDALKPILYTSLAAADDPHAEHYGLLAEDVAKVAPELNNWLPASMIAPGARVPDGYPSMAAYIAANANSAGDVPDNVQYDRVVPILIAEVKSLRARLKAAGIP